MTIYETTGGLFDEPTTPPARNTAVGTATLTFQTCNAATLAYSFTGGSSAGATGIDGAGKAVPQGCPM